MRTLSLPEVLDEHGESLGYGDLSLDERGNLAVAEGLSSLQQRVLQRLRFWQHEWFLAYEDGVPYYSAVFQRPINAGLASAILVEEVMQVTEVTRVSNVSSVLNPTTRRLVWSCIVHSAFGSTEVGIEV